MQPDRRVGNHPKRAFRADEQSREIVTGRRLARTRPGADDLAVGQHHRQPQHVLPHRSVPHGGRARRARGRHAADRAVGAGIDREREAGIAQRFVELQARDAGFHRRVEILDAHPQHFVHLAQVDRDAAVNRVDVPFEGGAGAERNDRHLMRRADLQDLGDLVCGVREADDVGRGVDVIRLAVAVMIANGRRIVRARSEQALQRTPTATSIV